MLKTHETITHEELVRSLFRVLKANRPGADFDALRFISDMEHEQEAIKRLLVRRMRDDGYTWEGVASALGVATQTAWRKYRDV